MADTDITVAIHGDTDDVEKKLENVNDKIEDLGDSATDAASEGFSDINEEASRLASEGLKSISSAAEQASAALNESAEAGAKLDESLSDTDKIAGKIEDVSDSMKDLGNEGAGTASDGLTSAGNAASKLATGGLKLVAKAAAAAYSALTAGATAATIAGMKYESAFAQTRTIMDQTVMSASDMSDAIQRLSNSTGQSAADLSESVYNAISATGDTANSVSLVADATKLATAGFAESSDALSVLTTVINAYGMSASDASAISDSLIEVQNLGVTTVAELSSAMGKAISTAAAYSIDLGNLESSYVSLTKAGISTEESTTYLSSMFNELGDTGSDVSAIINEKTGKSFGQLMASGESLGDVLQILIDYCDGDTEALMNLWSSAEAGKAASAIAGQGIDQFNDNLETIQNSAGATESAYETMTGTLSYQVDLLKTRVENFGTAIYDKFSGPMTDAVSTVADAFEDLIDSVDDGELADSVDNLADAVANFVESASELISDSLPGIIDGASWMLNNLGAVAGLLGSVATAVLALKVALASVNPQVTTLMTSLGMNPLFLTYAAGALAAGAAVGVLSVAGIELLDTFENADGSTQQFNESFAEVKDGVSDVETELQALIQEYNQAKAEIAGTTQSNTELISTLDSLTAGYDGSASALMNINSVIDQLNAAIPGLNLSFDEQSGTLSKSTEELTAINEQYEKQQQYIAAQNELTAAQQAQADAIEAEAAAQAEYTAQHEAYNEWAETHQSQIKNKDQNYLDWMDQLAASGQVLSDAKDKVAAADAAVANAAGSVHYYGEQYDEASEAVDGFSESNDEAADDSKRLSDEQKTLISSLQEIRDGCSNATGTASELREQYDTLKKTYEDLDTEGQDYRKELTEQALEQLNVRATSAELAEGLGYLASSAQIDYGTISNQLIATGETAEEFASTVTGALDSIVNGYEKYDTSTYTSLADSQAALEANTATQQDWVEGLTELWNQAVDSGDAGQMAYVQSLYNMGVESNGIVQDLRSGVGASLSTMADEYAASTAAAGEQAALGLAMSSGAVYEAGQALAEQATQGYEDGSSETGSAAEQAAEQAVTDFTSVDFQGAGTSSMDLVYTGITSRSAHVAAGAQQVANAVQNKFRNYDWQSVGTYIDKGIAKGITAGADSPIQAVKKLADDIYDAAMAEIDAHSPSKLFERGFGRFIPAGAALGITRNTYLATDAVKEMAADVTETARVATVPTASVVQSNFGTGTAADHTAGVMSILTAYLPQIIEKMGRDLVLDTGTLVGATADRYDQALGRTAVRKGRG